MNSTIDPVRNPGLNPISSLEDFVKDFKQETLIVWHDADPESLKNEKNLNRFKNVCNYIETFSDWEHAANFLRKEKDHFCHVITSGTNGKELVNEISGINNVVSIHIFCKNLAFHKGWSSHYAKVASVETNLDNSTKQVQQSIILWQRKHSCLRSELPPHALVSDGNHSPLLAFASGVNREYAKKDFLTLAEAFCGNNTYIKEFRKEYNNYSMESILRWYTKECFVYQVINNSLKTGVTDCLHSCRLILRDLEVAIKEKYHQKSKKFNGLLYRGARISEEEWTDLIINVGEEIEVHGFLSASKDKRQAVEFCKNDVDNYVVITIIVPDLPEKAEQGFAEVQEYSEYPEEDEVIFNINSKFTVLEASDAEIDGIICRHAVLLYGTDIMKKYITDKKPYVQVSVSEQKRERCSLCKQVISFTQDPLAIFASLSQANEYVCKYCVDKYVTHNNSPLIGLTPWVVQGPVLNIEGFVVYYHYDEALPFYGYNQCAQCGRRADESYCSRCLNCQQQNKVYCRNCTISQSNGCIENGHLILLESYPCSFWSEKEMNNVDNSHLEVNAQGDPSVLFKLAQTHHEAHRYKKAIKCYQSFLEQSGVQCEGNTIACYHNLGDLYNKLENYETAIEHFEVALKLRQKLLGENHKDTASTYEGLASVYCHMERHQEELECFRKALDIKKAVKGQTDPETIAIYEKIASASSHLNK